MIDLTREQPIPFAQVPKLPWLKDLRKSLQVKEDRPNRPLNVATIYRWSSKGLRGNCLEYVQLGGTRVTTEAALLRFFQHLTHVTKASAPQPVPQHPRDNDRIERQLDAILGSRRS